MLPSFVPLEVVLAREAIEVGAVGMFTAKGVHDGQRVSVLRLVSAKVLRVHEALAASRAHVRPLIAVGCLLVTVEVALTIEYFSASRLVADKTTFARRLPPA